MTDNADYVRVEDALLSVGADPEHSGIIHAYHHDPLVHALAHRLAECLERLLHLDGTETWRHADGTVREDHMDARPGDYFGLPLNDGAGGV